MPTNIDTPTETGNYSTIVSDTINGKADLLNKLGQYLWDNPELRFEETKAHDYITQYLESEGFKVQRHYILPTAFRAEFGGNTKEGSTVVIMCEYDALPNLGHACGHNLIAECSVAAGIAVKQVLKQDSSLHGNGLGVLGWVSLKKEEAPELTFTSEICIAGVGIESNNTRVMQGKTAAGMVVVLGTPAEEGGQGKVYLLEKGAFDGADVAVMAHPATVNVACPTTTALARFSVKYEGATAHAGAAPWNGINALDAAVGAYVNVSLLRQQMKPEWRATGIVQEGGTVSNLIPDKSQLEFTIRAPNKNELKNLQSKVQTCLISAADATGCTSVIEMASPSVEELISNKTMGHIYQKYAEDFGLVFDPNNDDTSGGSTDAGSVSHVIPVIHPLYKLNTTAVNHTAAYADATHTQESYDTTLAVAKALALTALDVLRDPDVLKSIKDEFNAEIKSKMTATLAKL